MVNEAEGEGEGTLTPPASPRTLRDCPTALLVLLFHGGSTFEGGDANKHADVSTLRNTLGAVIRAHYPQLAGRVAVQLVACATYVTDALTLLTSVSPEGGARANCCNPALLPTLAALSPAYDHAVTAAAHKANHVFEHFLQSDEGLGFQGEVSIPA